MVSFQQPIDILGLRRQLMMEDAAKMQLQRQDTKDIFNALEQFAGAYKDYKGAQIEAEAMDKGVGMMADIGVIEPDIRDSFMNLDRKQKPFVFDLLRQGMFAPYAAGQSAAQQAQAWDKYRSGGGGMPGGARNQYGYFYQGP